MDILNWLVEPNASPILRSIFVFICLCVIGEVIVKVSYNICSIFIKRGKLSEKNKSGFSEWHN